MGAVDVSRLGGLRHRSVFGGAASVKDPIHSGTVSLGMLSAVNDDLSGGIAAWGLLFYMQRVDNASPVPSNRLPFSSIGNGPVICRSSARYLAITPARDKPTLCGGWGRIAKGVYHPGVMVIRFVVVVGARMAM